ncbi:MAG TPA: bifunctional methylenetetrahydrofolate dehydrogenase/methenyltetrahydrofolate cyclohydrolase FolD [Gemmataceae bacterium]|jgi:methylenetetrahydrofolate dehydrogenase (NADP+)/methenyltetrahydrofolate cyclohydrolase|nr:bifunctional methylenetetrahydrofolate dehydrogenase/methenyltetrahydrofolate cyclohydrolase FolD [Gemmataceae bacterium]
MPARILDGKSLAETMQAEIAAGVAELVAAGGPKPGLATVLVGDDPASHVYVRNKRRACERVGMTSFHHELPAAASQAELLALVSRLNSDPSVHGILVQLPLPAQIDERAVIYSVNPLKDVDAFHPETVGLLAAGHPRFRPCTPHGIQQLLMRNNIPIAGAHVVIVGRSNIVGKPLALMLMQKESGGDATVTVAHSRSHDLPALTGQADILVAAVGRPKLITADMVRPGATVVDVGTNRVADGKLVGDVDYGPVSEIAGTITPVPGGVGPMTITMLLHNTLLAARLEG